MKDENVRIKMSDGVQLMARIWRPTSSGMEPVPAVLEFIPYRLRDFTAYRDSINHPYLAGHGYAAVRVDLRGSGEAEGVLTGEYLEQELTDAEEVLAWLAAQPWCSGRTAMMGISWGGFNALQLAARRPPSLGAIVTACSTDDRYADDVHYMGGCLLSDNLSWAAHMLAYNSCPPDPAVAGECWRQMWHERLDGSGLWLEEWLRHQRRDSFWQHGSVCENFAGIQVPVYAVSGWADGYSNSVLRLLAELDVPRKGLIGPWAHTYPQLGKPGPAIGFLQEVVRWWDRWLKGIDNGIMTEPMLRTWMQDTVPPCTAYEQRPGRWVGDPSWPSPRVREAVHPLAPHRIALPGERVEPQEPPPEPVRLSIFTRDSRLRLPIRSAGGPDDVSPRPFDEPEGAPPIPVTPLSPGEQRWTVSRDLTTHRGTLEVVRDLGLQRFEDIGLDAQERSEERYSWHGDDMSSARGETHWTMSFARGDWQVRTNSHTILTCTPTDFHVHARLDAYESGQRVHSATWERAIPRDHV